MARGIALIALAVLALSPGAADAARVAVDGDGNLVFRAAAGEANALRIEIEGEVIRIADRTRPSAGRGCEPDGSRTVRCTGVGGSRTFSLGNRDDTASAAGGKVVVFGGTGDDVLRGSEVGDVLGGGMGRDLVRAGGGNDVLRSEPVPDGADRLGGGRGIDVVDYQRRTRGVKVDFAGDADDGATRERDRVGSDVESARSGTGTDRLTGDGRANVFAPGNGSDVVRSGGGNDTIDELQAASTQDLDFEGVDRFFGGAGRDVILGDESDDRIDGGPDEDYVAGRDGTDRVAARDGAFDRISCLDPEISELSQVHDGSRATVDGPDFAEGCDDVDREGATAAAFLLGEIEWIGMTADVDNKPDGGEHVFTEIGCPAEMPGNCTGTVRIFEGDLGLGQASFDVARGDRSAVFVDVPLGTRARTPFDGIVAVQTTDSTGAAANRSFPVRLVAGAARR